jgi:hypothetical protein
MFFYSQLLLQCSHLPTPQFAFPLAPLQLLPQTWSCASSNMTLSATLGLKRLVRFSFLLRYKRIRASPNFSIPGSPITCRDSKTVWTSQPGVWGCSGSNDRADFTPATSCSTDAEGTQYIIPPGTARDPTQWYVSKSSLSRGPSSRNVKSKIWDFTNFICTFLQYLSTASEEES